MIKTEKGKTTFQGSDAEIAADLAAIIQAALENNPVLFLVALEAVCDERDAQERAKDRIDRQKETNEEQIRLEAFAAMLSHLPKEELEALKKKANGED